MGVLNQLERCHFGALRSDGAISDQCKYCQCSSKNGKLGIETVSSCVKRESFYGCSEEGKLIPETINWQKLTTICWIKLCAVKAV